MADRRTKAERQWEKAQKTIPAHDRKVGDTQCPTCRGWHGTRPCSR